MKAKRNEVFFDEISSFYDGMIGFDNALKRRQELLTKFLNKNIKTAADLGCGSGMDSIALAKSGIEVSAFDQSSGMIIQAMENAEKQGVRIKFKKLSLDKIPNVFNNKFDLVLSLGNTLANLEPSKLKIAIGRIQALLKPNGKVIIQILNYSSILKKKERIINITEQGEYSFIRFYDFYPEYLNFNILKFQKENLKKRILYTTALYPYDYRKLKAIMEQSGFKSIKAYGNLNLEKYQKYSSPDLIVIASN